VLEFGLGRLNLLTLRSLAVGEETGNDACCAECAEFDDLVLGVERGTEPVTVERGRLENGGQEDGLDGSAPAEEETGKHKWQDVQVMQDVMQYDGAWWRHPGDDGKSDDEECDQRSLHPRGPQRSRYREHTVIFPRRAQLPGGIGVGRQWERNRGRVHSGVSVCNW